MDHLLTTEALVALGTLAAMEIVLGIDNVVFLAILTSRLPAAEQPRARQLGLTLALGTRILLLLGISWVMGLTAPLFGAFGRDFSGKSLILLGGGLFLMFKATHEIYDKLEGDHQAARAPGRRKAFLFVLVQILLIDIVFSLDSVITAVGMANHVGIMILAMVIAMLVMLYFATPIADFVDRHPTIKVLALSFLILIGVMLVAEGLGQHMDKGYIYVAMSFSLVVELVNMRLRGPKKEKHETGAKAAR